MSTNIYKESEHPQKPKIETIYVKLNNYQYDLENSGGNWVGRARLIKYIVRLIHQKNFGNSAYLITGYRGIGKTSLLRKCIDKANEEERKADEVINRMPIEQADSIVPWIALTGCFLIAIILHMFSAQADLLFPVEWWSLEGALFVLTMSIVVYLIVVIFFWRIDKDSSPKQGELQSMAYKKFEVPLSQDDITETDVFRQVTQQLLNWHRKYTFEQWFDNRAIYWPMRLVYMLFRSKRATKLYNRHLVVKARLEHLNSRLFAKVSTNNKMEVEPSFRKRIGLGNISVASTLFKYSSNDQIAYSIASAKELEAELMFILIEFDKLRKVNSQNIKRGFPEIPKFVFILDELDKMEPTGNLAEFDDDQQIGAISINNSRMRQRQDVVGRLLGNLKAFLNSAPATFFFIGGRELYDASLADIADRDSFYSSIFSDVIYVNSFFKEKVYNRSSNVSDATELYLAKIMLNSEGGKDDDKILSNIFYKIREKRLENLKGLKEEVAIVNDILKKVQNNKDLEVGELKKLKGLQEEGTMNIEDLKKKNEGRLVFERLEYKFKAQQYYQVEKLLQNYIIYLTYRSNGTPKKLITLIEDIVVGGDNLGGGAINYFDPESGWYTDHVGGASNSEEEWFLKFTYQKQFEIFLTADLYRPYLVTNRKHVKAYGDKLLFSSAFIMDHLLKFHSFGFSWRNLETIPEVILGNADPNLRSFLERLLAYLSFNYLRPTISGLFQYKFYSEVSQDIALLAKTSEQSAAAFTFTLDESQQVKRHYKLKLRELEAKNKSYSPVTGMNNFVHSVAFLQTILGDLHFYDQEFEDSVIYYTDSIQNLRFPTHTAFAITSHQVFIWIRNMLKLALSLEKMKSFDSAYSIYQTLINDVPRYATWLKDKEMKGGTNPNGSPLDPFSNYRNLQMLNIPFLAKLALIEKNRFGGISQNDLQMARVDLYKLLLPWHDKEEKKMIRFLKRRKGLKDHEELNIPTTELRDGQEEFVEFQIHQLIPYRQRFLFADYYHNLGTIVYFKNNSVVAADKNKWKYIMRIYYPEIGDYLDRLESKTAQEEIRRNYGQDYRPPIISYYNYKKALWLLLRNQLEDELIQSNILDLLLEERESNILYGNKISRKKDTVLEQLRGSDNNPSLFSVIEESKYFEDEPIEASKNLLDLKTEVEIVESDDRKETQQRLLKAFVKSFPTHDLFAQSLLLLHKNFRHSWNVSLLYYAANLWTKLGDATLATMSVNLDWSDESNREMDSQNLIEALKLLKKSLPYLKASSSITNGGASDKVFSEVKQEWAQHLFFQEAKENLKYPDSAVALYFVAGLYFRNAVKSYSFAFQLYKILWVIYYCTRSLANIKVKSKKQKKHSTFILKLCDELLNTIKQALNELGGGALKKGEYGPESLTGAGPNNFYLLAVVVVSRIRYQLTGTTDLSNFKGIRVEKSPFIRVQYLGELNREKYKLYRDAKEVPTIPIGQKLELLVDGMYCCHEMIKGLNQYGQSFNIMQSQLASAHRKMGGWCEELLTYKNNNSKDYQYLINLLRKCFGREFPSHEEMDFNYHYRLAIQHYSYAIHGHSENQHYQSVIAEMYFLEDDFNDNLYHFSAALERVLVNNKYIRDAITKCRESMKRIGDEEE